MATLFEFRLLGDDPEHLEAVGEAALDEVQRIETVLSRYDPGSELARVNREAFEHPVAVSFELNEILKRCGVHHEHTNRRFDPCHGGPLCFAEAVRWEGPHHVRLAHPDCRIDLGGFGKGYALDAARQILAQFAVAEFLLHGVISSVLAGGEHTWPVNLRAPAGDQVLGTTMLRNEALSCSAFESVGTAVIAATGEDAEVWSTAILMAGRDHRHGWGHPSLRAVAWLEADIEWLTERRS